MKDFRDLMKEIDKDNITAEEEVKVELLDEAYLTESEATTLLEAINKSFEDTVYSGRNFDYLYDNVEDDLIIGFLSDDVLPVLQIDIQNNNTETIYSLVLWKEHESVMDFSINRETGEVIDVIKE